MIHQLWRRLTEYVSRVASAAARGDSEPVTDGARADAGGALAAAQAAVDLASRAGVWRVVDTTRRRAKGDHRPVRPIPRLSSVPDHRAIEAILSREPRLAQTAQAVRDAYATDGIAAIRAMDEVTIAHVQRRLATGLESGTPVEAIAEEIAQDTEWPRSYARLVVRTNLATARSDGVMAQTADPEVRRVLPALIYETAGDLRVRPSTAERLAALRAGRRPENHRALDGLIASVDWPGWDRWTPPGGYQCRCIVRPISRRELERLGVRLDAGGRVPDPIVPPEAAFHPGFGGRRKQGWRV
jgi:hypothetical protein